MVLKLIPIFIFQPLLAQSCYRNTNVTYETYLRQIGLYRLTRLESEVSQTHNHRDVYEYEGEPGPIVFHDVVPSTAGKAVLVKAYADAHSGEKNNN